MNEQANLSFSDFLSELNYGDVEVTASARLSELVRALRDHSADHHVTAKGSLTLKISLVHERGLLKTRAAVTIATPTPPTTEATLFLTSTGIPSAQDPRQGRLHFASPTAADDAAPRTV